MKGEENTDLTERTMDFVLRIVTFLKELDEPSGARQTARRCCPQGERGGTHQSSYWLEILVRASIVSESKLSALRNENKQLLAIFTAISIKAKS